MNEDVPHPVLLNTWKHHAGWIRRRAAATAVGGSESVLALCADLVVIGTRLMDLYTGPLRPAEIGGIVRDDLSANGLFEYEPLAAWLAGQGGYAMIALPDESRWTVRLGPATGRYLHLHPGRRSPHTVRVQANTLRTATIALAHAGVTGADPLDIAVVNEARARYLGLPPAPELHSSGGLGAIIAALLTAAG